MSQNSIMSVQELIDMAFSGPYVSRINFKIMQTILVLLAHQLRLLGRLVEVNVDEVVKNYMDLNPSSMHSTISISEMKIRAKSKQKVTKKATISQAARTSTTQLELNKKNTSLSKTKSGGGSIDTGTLKPKDKPMKDIIKSGDDKKDRSEKSQGEAGKFGEGSKKDSSKARREIEKAEVERERQLRVIQQRKDSHLEPNEIPEPMAPLDAQEEEILLIVSKAERDDQGSTDDFRDRDNEDVTQDQMARPKRRLSVVTQSEFDLLREAVEELQRRFAPIGSAEFPGNQELMEQLRDGASLGDAMAALQLSARLEAAEKALTNMTEMVSSVIAQGGKPTSKYNDTGPSKQQLRGQSQGHVQGHGQGPIQSAGPGHSQVQGTDHSHGQSQAPGRAQGHAAKDTSQQEKSGETKEIEEEVEYVPYTTFKNKFNDLREELLALFEESNDNTSNDALRALKKQQNLGSKLDDVLKLSDRVNNMEDNVNNFLQKINQFDSGVTLQLTSYQEALTQMQIDLDLGLEAMAEKLAHPMGDPGGIADLNEKFNGMQLHLDNSYSTYDEFKETLAQYGMDLEELWKKMEIIRDTKSDRDEVIDGLHDKVSLGMLNGFIKKEHFDAVKGDLEKKISMSYDKFNHQELHWQKAIDDLVKNLNDKTDTKHVIALRNDINDHLNKLKMRMEYIAAIVGEPKAFATMKKISHGRECLSCNTPANVGEGVEGEGHSLVLPKHNKCYPGHAVPHAVDARAHLCNRYCGGSHTLIPKDAKSHLSQGIHQDLPDVIVKTIDRNPHLEMGTDGRSYKTDEPLRPCRQCNSPTGHAMDHRNDTGEGLLPKGDEVIDKMQPLSFSSSPLLQSQSNFEPGSPGFDSGDSFITNFNE